jgi:hypothetical protein
MGAAAAAGGPSLFSCPDTRGDHMILVTDVTPDVI